MSRLMIYGATGYTARLATGYAKASGLHPVLGGRDAAALAGLDGETRAFTLGDPAAIDAALSGVTVLLNCAGPFLRTAEPLMRAAVRNGVHYLDIAAELDSYRLAERLDEEAAARGVMLLPGSGGSVAMLGCLAARAIENVPEVARIRIALMVSGPMSRGSAISATENVTVDCLAREGGVLVPSDPAALHEFDFGSGPAASFPLTLPDLITIWRETQVPNIETFVHVTGSAFPGGSLSALPDGPTEAERAANRYAAVAEVTAADGTVTRHRLQTVNGYTFTPMAAAEAARRVLAGQTRPGFQTPAGLFGSGFAETIADSSITSIPN
ncbi:saccharopine dehydrogenase family protein [Sphingobium ummariense]